MIFYNDNSDCIAVLATKISSGPGAVFPTTSMYANGVQILLP